MSGFITINGELSYNGIVFPPGIHAKVMMRPIPDAANRTTKYTSFRIEIACVLHDGQTDVFNRGGVKAPIVTLNQSFAEIRRRLSQRSGVLTFTDRGFGDLTINTTTQTVNYGPVPEVVTWEPVAGTSAVHLVWAVEVSIVQCDSSLRGDSIVELVYTAQWDIDEAGLTYRVISGHLEIPANLPSTIATTIPRTADFFRNRINVPVPLGFRRQTKWGLSLDKRVLNFTIVDTEDPSDNAYPAGVIRANVHYTVSNSRVGFKLWDVNLSGSITVGQGVPRWLAWAAFLIIVKSKRDQAVKAEVTDSSGKKKSGGILITRRFSLTENIFGRDMSFSLQWTLGCTLDKLLSASGVWQPIGTSWDAWRTSMTSLARNWDYRGHAQMRHLPSDDTIVNACSGGQSISINNFAMRGPAAAAGEVLKSKCPKPANSWLWFQNEIVLVHEVNKAVHRQLISPGASIEVPPMPDTVVSSSAPSGVPPIFQNITQGVWKVIMRGAAMRVCYPIPRMTITKLGGTPVVLTGRDEQLGRELATFDLPVYAATWHREYTMLTPPTGTLTYPEEIPTGAFQ